MNLLITLILFGVFALGVPAQAADAQAGKSVFDSKCKTCHGPEGKGNPAIAKSLKVEFKDMASKEVQAKTDDQFKKTITEGTGKMQPVKGLPDQQVQDVIAFVRTLAKS